MIYDTVFPFDVDNTLLDRVQADLDMHIRVEHGTTARNRYWEIFEALGSEPGYADYLGALKRYRREDIHDPRILRFVNWLADYPFTERLYRGVLDELKHAQQWAPAVILSDGDAVFQPRKVERSGLWQAFDGHVLIYIHKEEELDDVERLYPARHYVMTDDKLRILDKHEEDLGRSPHNCLRPARSLRYRSGDPGPVSVRRCSACQDRRPLQIRSCRPGSTVEPGAFATALGSII